MKSECAMPASTQEPIAYQHPRWFVRCAAIGFAFLYACGLVAANVFPHGDQEHGWPFVYMVRQLRVPGPLPNIIYGPWPLDDPPIVQFRPTLLVLNCLCGMLLAVLATIMPAYWLRVRQRPVQFSLRTLFVLTTVVACLLAVLKGWYPDQLNSWNALALAIVSLFLLVYVVPACMVLTAAHWLVVRSARSGRPYRWFGLHWLTWLAVCAVGGPLLHYMALAPTGLMFLPGSTLENEYGWPFNYSGECNGFPLRCFTPAALVADLVVCLAITAATGFVVERWARRVERRVPMRKVAFVAAALAVIVTIWIVRTDQSTRPNWYDYYSCVFGLAATILAIEVLTVRHWKAVPKLSLLAGTLAGAPVWFTLSPLLLQPRLASGLSLVTAAFAVTVVDAGYRDLMHRDRGAIRFVHPACGEHVAVLPMWSVGVIGIGVGLVLLYT